MGIETKDKIKIKPSREIISDRLTETDTRM